MGVKSSSPLSAPEPINADHDATEFDCGEEQLSDWLRRRALRNHESGASRTYVVCEKKRVVAFYSLAVGAITQATATGRVRRNMPEPIPVMILARLAVDSSQQGKGLGRALLRDALLRTLQAAEIAGIRAILVHAISDSAKNFYLANGFMESPVEPMTLMITLEEVRRSA